MQRDDLQSSHSNCLRADPPVFLSQLDSFRVSFFFRVPGACAFRDAALFV
jgi:hypothetical protein